MNDKVFILNPHYHLKHDIHRVILFSRGKDDENCSYQWHTFIHPLQAAMLSFFTYNRPYRETITLLCDFFCRSREDMERWVSKFIENPSPVYTHSAEGKIHFPKRVLIDASRWKEAFHYRELDIHSFACKTIDLTTRRLFSRPSLVTFMLTNRCVTHCLYCYADTTTPVIHPLPTSRILSLIEEAERLQVQQIGLMGGEIFLHPDWQQILYELVKRDIAPDVISTKMPMTSKLINQLEATGYQGILQVSLDSCNERIAQETLGVKEGYVSQMLEGIRLLDESTLNYQIASVLTTYNCDITTLSEMYIQIANLKRIRDWRIVPVHNSITKEFHSFAKLKPSKGKIIDVNERLREIIKKPSFPIIIGVSALEIHYNQATDGSCSFKGKKCSALNTHLFILPDGKATICEQLYWNPHFIVGDVSTSGIQEVWLSDRAKKLYNMQRDDLQSDTVCRDCALFESCFSYHNRCWTDIIKAYGRDCWDYPDPRCQFAPPMKNKLDYEQK